MGPAKTVFRGEFAKGHCEAAMHSQMLAGVSVILPTPHCLLWHCPSAVQCLLDGDANRDWALSLELKEPSVLIGILSPWAHPLIYRGRQDS